MPYLSIKLTPVSTWLRQASKRLTDCGISSAKLDAELLLAESLGVTRTWLHARPERLLTSAEQRTSNRLLIKRSRHVPVAYLVGHKDFYGRDFIVDRHTLVPRPESEDMIVLLEKYVKPEHLRLVDVGTGSGCLGITAKLELPHLEVTLLDVSKPALKIACANAQRLAPKVKSLKSNLMNSYKEAADIILANLPYVNPTWDVSPSTRYEPASALYAGRGGLDLIFKLIEQTKDKLATGGLMIIEADPSQHPEIINYARVADLKKIAVFGYQIAFTKG